MINLPLRNNTQTREQPLKSPRRMGSDALLQTRIEATPELRGYLRAFRKQIELPVNFETSIFQSKTPQRCMTHNNIITLFCLTDRRPLCVHCMYQVLSHKKHEVVPISKAAQAMQDELSTMLHHIEQHVRPRLERLAQQQQLHLARVQQEMAEHVASANRFYNELSSIINSNKNEHLKYCQELGNKLKHDYQAFSNQLNKTNSYLKERTKQIAERTGQEHLLFNHNISSYLIKVDSIIPSNIEDYQPLQSQKVQKQMDTAISTIREALNFSFNFINQKIPRKSLERNEELEKNDKTVVWKRGKPGFPTMTTQKSHSPKIDVYTRFFYKQESKQPLTPREQANQLKSPRKIRQKPSFISKNMAKLSEDPLPKQSNDKTIKLSKSKQKMDE